MLDDTVDVDDKMFKFDKSGDPLNDQNILLDLDESSYSSLKEYNRKLLHTSIK
jgi:hypothetical protein